MAQSDDATERNRALQREWYGEPLGSRLGRLVDQLRISQTELAATLGLSAPMLSQLMHGHRAKISNPAVLSRLVALEELASSGRLRDLGQADVRRELAGIHDSVTTASSAPAQMAQQPRRDDLALGLQLLLRAVASAAELEAAAGMLQDDFPELATILRVYGTGRTSQARDHLARTLPTEGTR